MKKHTYSAVSLILALVMIFSVCLPVSAEGEAYEPTMGRVDEAPAALTGGAQVFVYVPDGSNGAAQLTEPILMVYGGSDYTASSAAKLAEESGLAALAKRENSVIAFVNSIGETWGEADATAYSAYAGGLFAERDNQAGGGRWDAALNRYSNGKYSGYTGHRYYVMAEGSGADFVSAYLADDTISTYYGWGGSSVAMPASVMLFNTTALPTKGTIALEYPAIVVNGSEAVNGAYAALNKSANHFVSVSSETTSGFDYDVLKAQFNKLIAVRRSNLGSNNTAIFDLPVYEALGVDVIEAYTDFTVGGSARQYLTFLPSSVKAAQAGTVPLVMLFHGAGEKAEYVALLSTWPELGAKEGFITVSVDNHSAITNDQMVLLIEKIFADYPMIDKTRVYSTGFSMGSMKTFTIGTQLTRYFAAIAPMNAISGGATGTGLLLPTYYITGYEDSTYPSGANTMMNYLYRVNDIRDGTYAFDATAGNRFGVKFDSSVTVPGTHGIADITFNTLKSNNGIVYTMFTDATHVAHNIYPDQIPYAWDFLKQFSRNADGSVSIAGTQECGVSVSTPTIVATLAANLNITVTGAPEGVALKAFLEVGGKHLYGTDIVNGKGRMAIDAAPEAGTCRLVVIGQGVEGSCEITVTPYSTDIWTANAYTSDGKLYVKFNEDMTLKSAAGCVTVNGASYGASILDDKRTAEVLGLDASALVSGTVISVKGVKFPVLFPSYSFTYTVKLP